MDNREVRELLAARTDQLVGAGVAPPSRMTQHDRVQGLLDLAEQLQGILVPVAPEAHFRRRLHGELILAAQRRQAEPEVSLFQQHRKGILIGAAAIGSVASVAGVVIAYVLRHRRNGATHMTAS
jgi:hypothetical protein